MIRHFKEDLKIGPDELVFMHSGLVGLGIVEGGVQAITDAFAEILPKGMLVIPTFTYSWCKGEVFDLRKTECPSDLGGYAQHAWKDKKFARSSNPNFSVAALQNDYNEELIRQMFEVGRSCFGKQSVFDNMYQLCKKRRGHIILFGGAHSDVLFRTTFVHLIEEIQKVPYRYLKRFYEPVAKKEWVDQLVRFMSAEEYKRVRKIEPKLEYVFPVEARYQKLGNDLIKEKLIQVVPFAYSKTRKVDLKVFCDYLTDQMKSNPNYLLQ